MSERHQPEASAAYPPSSIPPFVIPYARVTISYADDGKMSIDYSVVNPPLEVQRIAAAALEIADRNKAAKAVLVASLVDHAGDPPWPIREAILALDPTYKFGEDDDTADTL